jgi:hypothetical protein
MLAVYLTCLIVGGVFVGLSALGGLGKDADAGPHMGGAGDHEHHLHLAHDGDHAHGPSLADASQGTAGAHGARRPAAWIPFLSFRFWTFGSAFFGLTGTLITLLALAGEPLALLLSGATGFGVGTLSAWIVRVLRQPVGAEAIEVSEYQGQVGELILPLVEGGLGKMRVRIRHRERELIVRAEEPVALPRGARVLVLGLDEDGRARIVPESSLDALPSPAKEEKEEP